MENCIVTSLNYDGLVQVRELNDRINTGHIVAKTLGDITAQDVDLLSAESGLVTLHRIRKSHARNKEVRVWTVNDPAKMDYFIDLRVDNIITDYPEELVEILKKRAGMSEAERIYHRLSNWLK